MKLHSLCASIAFALCAACASPDPAVAGLAELRPSAAPSQPTRMQEADALYQAQQWADALALYRTELAARPQDVGVLNRIAHCEHLLGRYEGSLAAWTELARLREKDPTARYNIACANAQLGRVDAAFASLDEALARGFRDAKTLAGDGDLEVLRRDPRFEAIVRRVGAATAPTTSPSPAVDQFAFWVGEWDVFSANGGRAGASRIERILGGFVILENWSGADGMSGKSFNTYDPSTQRWRQHWVDDRGGVLDFRDGQFVDGVLTFHASWSQPDGSRRQRRLSFTDLGEAGVRQYSELSTDGGSTWTQEYELFYRRKAAQ